MADLGEQERHGGCVGHEDGPELPGREDRSTGNRDVACSAIVDHHSAQIAKPIPQVLREPRVAFELGS